MSLKDSGNRTTFGDGAQRDMEEGKGRCDLLPLGVVGDLLEDYFFLLLEKAIKTDCAHARREMLIEAIELFSVAAYDGNMPEMFLEVAKQYEDGAKKYSDRNWEKGLPLFTFFDSGIRHYLKWLDNWTDEPHDRAVTWNLLGALWYTEKELEETYRSLDEEMNKVGELAEECRNSENVKVNISNFKTMSLNEVFEHMEKELRRKEKW